MRPPPPAWHHPGSARAHSGAQASAPGERSEPPDKSEPLSVGSEAGSALFPSPQMGVGPATPLLSPGGGEACASTSSLEPQPPQSLRGEARLLGAASRLGISPQRPFSLLTYFQRVFGDLYPGPASGLSVPGLDVRAVSHHWMACAGQQLGTQGRDGDISQTLTHTPTPACPLPAPAPPRTVHFLRHLHTPSSISSPSAPPTPRPAPSDQELPQRDEAIKSVRRMSCSFSISAALHPQPARPNLLL